MNLEHPVLRVVPMAADRNTEGDVFGGWMLGQADVAGSIVAYRRARGRVVTVAVRNFEFLRPVLPGDIVSFYAEIAAVGRTSLTVALEAAVERADDQGGTEHLQVARAELVYVALDHQGRPRAVDPS